MNEFEAFRRAIEIYRDGGWNSTRPNSPTLQAGKDHRTIREICALVINSRAKLPQETIADLLQCLNLRYPGLARTLERDRTYASGARCLLELMDNHHNESAVGIKRPLPTNHAKTAIS